MPCTDCKESEGAQHKPSCHRQGLVTSASDYGRPDARRRTPLSAISDRQDYLTTTLSGHDDGGCIEVVTNLESGRCMLLCNKCGEEVGFGQRREEPAFILQDDAVKFLMGVKS